MQATQRNAVRRQPIRSARRACPWPRDAERPEQEDERAHRRAVAERLPLQPVDGVRERADEREEERAGGDRDAEKQRITQLRPHAAAARRRVDVGEPPPHHDGGGCGQDRERADRNPPVGHRGDERDPDAADEPADDEREHVRAHRLAAERRPERLEHVGDADGEQAGHAQPLCRAAREQHVERRRRRRGHARNDEQRARQDERALAPDVIRERPPQPHTGRHCRDHDRDREARLCRADVEVAPELGQDRLRRVHGREHAGASQQEAGHAAERMIVRFATIAVHQSWRQR